MARAPRAYAKMYIRSICICIYIYLRPHLRLHQQLYLHLHCICVSNDIICIYIYVAVSIAAWGSSCAGKRYAAIAVRASLFSRLRRESASAEAGWEVREGSFGTAAALPPSGPPPGTKTLRRAWTPAPADAMARAPELNVPVI